MISHPSRLDVLSSTRFILSFYVSFMIYRDGHFPDTIKQPRQCSNRFSRTWEAAATLLAQECFRPCCVLCQGGMSPRWLALLQNLACDRHMHACASPSAVYPSFNFWWLTCHTLQSERIIQNPTPASDRPGVL